MAGRWRWSAAVALLAAGLAACGQAPAPPAAAPVGPPHWTTAACPRPDAHVVVIGEPPGRHDIPSGFQPTWVLRCLITPSRNGPSVLVTQRADLTAEANGLVRSLRQPSEASSSSGCPQDSAAHTVVVPYFALVDANGRALLPGLPSDECGRPLAASVRALSSLTYQRLSTTPMR